MAKHINMCSMSERMCKDLLVIAINWPGYSEIWDKSIILQRSDQFGWPVGSLDDRVVIHLRVKE